MLKELKAHHRNIIQMSFNGFKAPEIAERIGVSTITISQVLNSPLGKAYLNGLNDKITEATIDVRKELISMNKNALTTLGRLLDPEQKAPASVQLNAAKDVLDRSGFKAPDKLNIDMVFQTKSDEEIDAEITALQGSISKTQFGGLAETDSKETADGEGGIELIPRSDYDPEPEPLVVPKPELSEEIKETLNNTEFDPFNNIKK